MLAEELLEVLHGRELRLRRVLALVLKYFLQGFDQSCVELLMLFVELLLIVLVFVLGCSVRLLYLGKDLDQFQFIIFQYDDGLI